MKSDTPQTKSLTSWVQEHAVPVAGLIVGLTYIMVPYTLYSVFFGHFNVGLSSVGLDRGTILTTAALALLFTAALFVSIAAILVACFGIPYIALGLMYFLAVQGYRVVRRLVVRRLRDARSSKTVDSRAIPLQRLNSTHSDPGSDREEANQGSGGAVASEESSILSPQGLRSPSLRRQLAWLVAGTIGFYLIATYLWFHLPKPRNKILSSNWISIVIALWISVIVFHLISRLVSEQDFSDLVRVSRRVATVMLPGAIASSILLILILSISIGEEVAKYIEKYGVQPDTVPAPVLDVSGIRCVRLRYLDPRTMSSSKGSKPSEPVLYLGESNDTVVLYDSQSRTLTRVPVSNLAMEPVAAGEKSPCGNAE